MLLVTAVRMCCFVTVSVFLRDFSRNQFSTCMFLVCFREFLVGLHWNWFFKSVRGRIWKFGRISAGAGYDIRCNLIFRYKHFHRCMWHDTNVYALCLRKNVIVLFFCDNFVRCRPILLIFGRTIPEWISETLITCVLKQVEFLSVEDQLNRRCFLQNMIFSADDCLLVENWYKFEGVGAKKLNCEFHITVSIT